MNACVLPSRERHIKRLIKPLTKAPRVETMRIFGDAPSLSSSLDFNAYDAGLGELAFIVESGRIQSALWQCLDNAAHIKRYCPVACDTLLQHANDQIYLC